MFDEVAAEFFGGFDAGLEGDVAVDALALDVVGEAHDRGFGDGGVGDE